MGQTENRTGVEPCQTGGSLPAWQVEQIEAAVANVVVPAILRGVTEHIAETVAWTASPYRNRVMAAGYLQCSPSAIDKLRAQGRLVPRYVGVVPLYAVKDLEKIIREDTASGKRRKTPRKEAA